MEKTITIDKLKDYIEQELLYWNSELNERESQFQMCGEDFEVCESFEYGCIRALEELSTQFDIKLYEKDYPKYEDDNYNENENKMTDEEISSQNEQLEVHNAQEGNY